ncbi:MAG: hypothetical protein A4E37_00446 [Methanoregulaceae archaeon PtaB.Bin056]|nr:MAG: hypothetical protein A4E37_00446 [Methanoregulaceae archaeon PtaB.Bin056]
MAVQVCYEITEKNREREIRSLLEAMDEFGLKRGLILTSDQEDEMTVNGKTVMIKLVWKWLLEESIP